MTSSSARASRERANRFNTGPSAAPPDEIERVARSRFGITYLYPVQRFVVSNVLEGNRQIVVLPTGAGKSLCFQLPSLLLARADTRSHAAALPALRPGTQAPRPGPAGRGAQRGSHDRGEVASVGGAPHRPNQAASGHSRVLPHGGESRRAGVVRSPSRRRGRGALHHGVG